MTPRKLTPAEALECLRDWCNLCMSDFDRKWGERKTGQMVDIAVAALEEALLQKPAAVDLAKSWAGHVQWMAELEARDKALLERIKAIRPTEPAAPVPSDEEIAELRRRFKEITPVSWISVHAAIEEALPALLDMAERCAKAEAELAKLTCKCSLRTKLVGDGCDICNPEASA